MNFRKNKIVLVGAGNVATHLGLALHEKGIIIEQVYSYTLESSKKLGEKLNTLYTNHPEHILSDADIYIFSIKDSRLPALLSALPFLKGLLIHTAGSLPLSVFAAKPFNRYGVFYPLQTFSKDRELSFREIPIFIEANNPDDENLLEELGFLLSEKVVRLSSEKRQYLHLAAVFACNFVNHMYVNASEILEKENLPGEYLLPLIKETASKIEDMHPKDAQTGPAVRYDSNIINKHLDLLKYSPEKENLYSLLTKSINHKQNS